MKKIYVAGCGGMLGEAFYKKLNKEFNCKFTDKDVNADWLEFLDFRNSSSYIEDVINFDPDLLVHLGAYTSLEYCDKNELDALNNNVTSLETAVLISNRLDIPLLFISTAGIFDGNKDDYDDWDLPNPLGVYARSKVLAEDYISRNAKKYYVMRAGWMMGGGPKKDKKFVGKILSQIKNGAKILNIVNDKDGTPTYTHDFADVALKLVNSGRYGIYNCVCEGLTSRLEVAHEIIRVLNRDSVIKINEVNSDFFKKEYFSKRPRSERLLNKKLEILGLNDMRDWKVSLKEYILKYYSNY